MARIGDEPGHRHGFGERPAGPLERAADQREHGARLLVELAADVLAVEVGSGGLPGEPDDAPAFRDHRRRESAGLLLLGAFEMLDVYAARFAAAGALLSPPRGSSEGAPWA